MPSEPTAPESRDSDMQPLMLQLLQETRDDTRKLVEGMADLRARVVTLESNQGPQANMKRDAGLVAGASALVGAIMTILSALGVIHTPAPAPALPPPPAMSAPAAPAP